MQLLPCLVLIVPMTARGPLLAAAQAIEGDARNPVGGNLLQREHHPIRSDGDRFAVPMPRPRRFDPDCRLVARTRPTGLSPAWRPWNAADRAADWRRCDIPDAATD